MNWDDLRLFLAVGRNSGLAGAAAVTGKSPPTLGRRMLALEKSVGLELFERLPRGYDLTDAGQEFFERIAALEAQIAPLARTPGRRDTMLVKISAGTWMTQVLCERARLLLGDDSRITLRFISADHVLDIVHREAVIGIRNHRPDQPGLACRRVGRVRFAGYATNPEIHRWARVLGKTPSAHWLAGNTDLSDCIEVTTARNALDLAKTGLTRALLPTFVGDAVPELRRVTSPIDELEHDQWLVTHHEERFVPEIRRTIDRTWSVLRSLHQGQDTQEISPE